MLKRLTVAVAALLALATSAFAAGTIPGFSLTPQFDLTGKVAPGCKLYVIQAGTPSTPQQPYQDSGLTILAPNPLTCDAAGRLPQWFVADGSIKVRLIKSDGTQIFVGDNLLVVGASSGGGGGSPVDPTTILATGYVQSYYGTGVLSGFVRLNGRTIGSASSGATERANADTSALFAFLWGADPNLAVSGGRGANAAADFSANKTIALPDGRGRSLSGLDDMGNSAASRITTATCATPTTLGTGCGTETKTLTQAQLPASPPLNPTVSITEPNGGQGHLHGPLAGTATDGFIAHSTGGGAFSIGSGPIQATTIGTTAFATTGIAAALNGNLGSGNPISSLPPVMLITYYIKL